MHGLICMMCVLAARIHQRGKYNQHAHEQQIVNVLPTSFDDSITRLSMNRATAHGFIYLHTVWMSSPRQPSSQTGRLSMCATGEWPTNNIYCCCFLTAVLSTVANTMHHGCVCIMCGFENPHQTLWASTTSSKHVCEQWMAKQYLFYWQQLLRRIQLPGMPASVCWVDCCPQQPLNRR